MKLTKLKRFTIFLGVVALTSCGYQKTGETVVTECILPDDQSGTMNGHWETVPVLIALSANDFSSDEALAITEAADTWNDFFSTSQSLTVLDYGDASSPDSSTTSMPSSVCSQGLVTDGQFTDPVVIYKISSGWAYDADIIALTSYCPVQDTPYNRFYMAVMEINYENFFVSGTKLPDLQSIILHELGHLLGLDHSCESDDLDGIPNCGDADLSTDYYEAVMFPHILFPDDVNGEERHNLKSNDMGRANCLYEVTE